MQHLIDNYKTNPVRNTHIVFFCLCAFVATLLNACDSDDEDFSAVVNFDNPSAKDSVYTNENYTLTGTVNADGQIGTIRFLRNYFFKDQELEVEMAGTKMTAIPENPFNFSVLVPAINKDTKVRVVVTGTNGQEVSSGIYTINERKMNIDFYPGLELGGWNSMYGSCLDVDAGTPYGSSALGNDNLRPLVDVFFDRAKLACLDLDSMYYDNAGRFTDTGLRFAPTTFSGADFDAMKGDDMFVNLEATRKEIDIQVGSVVFFKAKSGKKGLLKVVSMTAPEEDLVLEEKIQK